MKDLKSKLNSLKKLLNLNENFFDQILIQLSKIIGKQINFQNLENSEKMNNVQDLINEIGSLVESLSREKDKHVLEIENLTQELDQLIQEKQNIQPKKHHKRRKSFSEESSQHFEITEYSDDDYYNPQLQSKKMKSKKEFQTKEKRSDLQYEIKQKKSKFENSSEETYCHKHYHKAPSPCNLQRKCAIMLDDLEHKRRKLNLKSMSSEDDYDYRAKKIEYHRRRINPKYK